MSAAVGLMGVLPSDDADDAAWDVLVARARDLVSRLRVGGRRVDDAEASAATVAALEAITAEAAEDEEFVAALGEVSGHDRVMRGHRLDVLGGRRVRRGTLAEALADRDPRARELPRAGGGLGLRPDRGRGPLWTRRCARR